MKIPSLVWLPLYIAVAYVGVKGLLCCTYDFAAFMVRREEKKAEQESETAVMSRGNQVKTLVFWGAILFLGYMAFLLLRSVM